MTQKIGVEAVLEDAQFQAALKSYLKGLDAMEDGADDLIDSSKGLAKADEVVADSMDEVGDSATESASKIEIMEKAMVLN